MLYDNLSINSAGHLTFAGLDTVELAAQHGTALMVMDEARLRSRCQTYIQAMKDYLPAGSALRAFTGSCRRRAWGWMWYL